MPSAPPDDAAAVAARLLGRPAAAIERVGNGGNSRVYRVTVGGGEVVALKRYPPATEHDRFGAERAALEFFAAQGVAEVPRWLAGDGALPAALLGWEEGRAVTAPAAAEVDAALAFMARLHRLARAPAAATLAAAAEACLCGAEVVRQVEGRLARLAALPGEEALRRFLAAEAAPLLAAAVEEARRRYRRAGLSFAAAIGREVQTLSGSDFGFHNALRRGDGSLLFLDFEYFGWDDPVKLTADFLWHPAMALPEPLKRRFAAGAGRLYGGDGGFATRLRALFPLYGMRWCMILLNEFDPAGWARRAHARAASGDERQAAKARQLTKARRLLDQIREIHDSFPYDP